MFGKSEKLVGQPIVKFTKTGRAASLHAPLVPAKRGYTALLRYITLKESNEIIPLSIPQLDKLGNRGEKTRKTLSKQRVWPTVVRLDPT